MFIVYTVFCILGDQNDIKNCITHTHTDTNRSKVQDILRFVSLSCEHNCLTTLVRLHGMVNNDDMSQMICLYMYIMRGAR